MRDACLFRLPRASLSLPSHAPSICEHPPLKGYVGPDPTWKTKHRLTHDPVFRTTGSVQHRLLSNGACKGGTPEAFYRRKRERARARKEQELEKARQAVALVAGIRARNAAAISASRRSSGDSGVGSEEGRSSSLSAPTIQGALHLTTPAAAVGLDEATRIGEAGAGGGGRGVAAAVAVAGAQEEAGGATGGGVGGGAVATAAGPVAPASVDYSPGGSGGDSKPSSELSGSNVSVDAPRDTPERAINKPDGDRDTDVRRYEQGFPGLSSAYGAYSSVFNSQVDFGSQPHLSNLNPCRLLVPPVLSASADFNVFFFTATCFEGAHSRGGCSPPSPCVPGIYP